MSPSPKHALCLSGGGVFGAYQAGAWLELSRVWKPQLITGISAGALNAYAIASGQPPEKLVDRWRTLPDFARHHIRFPFLPWNGFIDAAPLEAVARELCDYGKPVLPLGVAALRWNGFKQVLFRDEEVTWKHLAASCAIPFVLPQYEIDGHRHGDAGPLGSLPIWAAVQMGATHIIAVDVTPRLPALIRLPLLLVKRLRVGTGRTPSSVVVVNIRPRPDLGGYKDAAWWNAARVERYIERGRADAKAAWAAIS